MSSPENQRLRLRVAAIVIMAASVLATGSTMAQEIEATEEKVSSRADGAADQHIAKRLSDIFATLEVLDQVQVEAEAGVVRLSGEVLSTDARNLAGTLARQIEGVVAVENDLEESRALRRRLVAVLEDLGARGGRWLAALPLLVIAILVLSLFVALGSAVGRARRPFVWMTENVFLRDVARQLARAIVLVVGVLLSLEILGATTLVGAVLGTAGVVGLAVGFAFRDLVENYIASILLSLRQPFAPNDHVIIEGQEGKVLRLTSRATVLLSLDGNHIRIPNAAVFKGTIVNYTRKPERRFDFAVGLGVDQDAGAAQALAAETLVGIGGVLAEPAPFALVESLGESTVDLRVFGWIDQRKTDWGRLRSEAIRRVKETFDAAGFDMPEPVYRVRVEKTQIRKANEPAAPASLSAEQPLDTSAEHHLERDILEERASEEPDLLDSDGLLE